MTSEDLSSFKHEITIMSLIKSPFIVQLFGGCFEEGNYSIIMEYLPHPFRKIFTLNKKQKYQVGIDIVSGVEYLHKRNIVHSDLKSVNILLTNEYRAKICDFGVSKIKSTVMSTVAGPSNAGTVHYQAPELLEGGKSSKITDIFSLGAVLWEIYSNEVPFSKQIIKGKVQEIKTIQNVAVARIKGLKLMIPNDIPPQMKKMISICLSDEPEERPNANQI